MAALTSPEAHRPLFTHIVAPMRHAAAWLDTRDRVVMLRLNHWRPPRWMRLWMIAATRGGDGWLWYAMGLIVVLFGGPDRIPALAAAAVAVGLGIALFLKLKRAIGRRRPCAMEPHCWATLLPPDQFSFPSGHTITAFAVALSLGSFYPAMLPGLLFCAASVALSRVLLGMHFLTDVLAGAALGAALGEICATLLHRF
jgi:undecaprenyl-diphosphatase